MLDDQALANRRVAARVRLGGVAAGPLLLDGWERLHTSHSEAEEINRLAQGLLKAPDHGGALRANIAEVAADTSRMLGDFKRAHDLQADLGRITSWQIIGPFESDQHSGLEMPYPHEKSVDLSAPTPEVVEVGGGVGPKATRTSGSASIARFYPGAGRGCLPGDVGRFERRMTSSWAEADNHPRSG
jgi:hypothetical protein